MITKTELTRLQQKVLEYDKTREKLLELSRKTTRLAGWAIIQTHRRQLSKAKMTMHEAEETVAQISNLLNVRPELRQAGYIVVAHQEFSEAKILFNFVTKKKLLTQREVGTSWMEYLLGLLDFIGELRRMTMDLLKTGELKEAQRTFESMETIFEDLLSLDRTSIIPTFRRKMDTAKKLIEVTRADVIDDTRRVSLEKAIKGLEKRMR